MAKKKNQTKKHRFKYSEPEMVPVGDAADVARSQVGAVSGEIQSRQHRSVAALVAGARNFSYVGGDLRRICLLAGGLMLFEVVLWLLFTRTGLGSAVYHLVQV